MSLAQFKSYLFWFLAVRGVEFGKMLNLVVSAGAWPVARADPGLFPNTRTRGKTGSVGEQMSLEQTQ